MMRYISVNNYEPLNDALDVIRKAQKKSLDITNIYQAAQNLVDIWILAHYKFLQLFDELCKFA